MDIVTRVHSLWIWIDQGEVFHAMGNFVTRDHNSWIQISRGDNPYCTNNRVCVHSL